MGVAQGEGDTGKQNRSDSKGKETTVKKDQRASHVAGGNVNGVTSPVENSGSYIG